MSALFVMALMRLLGTQWQHLWMCFCNFQMLIFHKQNEKLRKKERKKKQLLCVFLLLLIIPFLLAGPVVLLFSLPLTL